MTSQELSHWWALFEVHAEEMKRAKDRLDSGDGQVIEYGRDEDNGDDGDDGDESV